MRQQRGHTGMRHGRAHRAPSLLSDDSCGGMLPVKLLLWKSLHTQQQQLSAAATLRQQGRTGTRHGRAYREASWISDDICEGMLPVSRLSVKTLHTRPAAAVDIRQVSGGVLPQRCLYGPHGCTRSPSRKPQRALRRAPPFHAGTAPPQGRMAARAHRRVSLSSDDICGGMLPVKRLS